MNTYLVRLRKNAELVGLFVSPDDESLWEFVDECCDPDACEFLELPPGGIYLSNAGAAHVPANISDPENDASFPDWFSGGTISELWLDIFFDHGRDHEWVPIEPDET